MSKEQDGTSEPDELRDLIDGYVNEAAEVRDLLIRLDSGEDVSEDTLMLEIVEAIDREECKGWPRQQALRYRIGNFLRGTGIEITRVAGEYTTAVRNTVDGVACLTPEGCKDPPVAGTSTKYLIVQQGGSSTEWYSELCATKEAAEDRIREIKEASYDAIGPFEVPESLAAGGVAHEKVIDLICSSVADHFTQVYLATVSRLRRLGNISWEDFMRAE